MTKRTRAYLAGPDVFLPDALTVGRRKVALCAEFGIEAHFPLDNEVGSQKSGRPLAMTISRLNEELIERCDIVLANITPFRSPSLDPGTAYEIGYARALKKRIYGYSAANESLLQRTHRFFRLAGGAARDADGYAIEDFGLADNLMIDGAIETSGGFIVAIDEPSLAAFAAFEGLISRLAANARLLARGNASVG